MFYNIIFLIIIGACAKKTKCLAIGICDLNVDINFSNGPEVYPTVLCSSNGGTADRTFYYFDSTLQEEFNSVVEITFDSEGNVFCQVIPITQEILQSENLTILTSEDGASTISISEYDQSSAESSESESLSAESEESQSQSVESEESQSLSAESEESQSLSAGSEESQSLSVESEESQSQSAESQESQSHSAEPEESQFQSDESENNSTTFVDPENNLINVEDPTENELPEEFEDQFAESSGLDVETSEGFNGPENEILPIEDPQFEPEESNKVSEGNQSENFSDFQPNENDIAEGTGELETVSLISEPNENFEGNSPVTFSASQRDSNSSDATLLESNEIEDLKCSKGWILNPNSNTCYFVTKNTMNWHEANRMCVDLGGKLSVFHTQAEFKYVKENVDLPEKAWIGLEYTLSDDSSIKKWTWVDRTVADFTDWANGEPSSQTGFFSSFWGYEDCVEIKRRNNFHWNNDQCTKFKRALCSKGAELVPRNTCPDGWVREGEKCYHYCPKELPQELALLKCSSHAIGGKLFTPEGVDELNLVSDHLKEFSTNSIWLGFKDSQENGDFRTPEGEPQTFFNWDQKEPSQSFWWFSVKECVQMSSKGKMKRVKCGENLPFVCTIDL